MLNVAQEQQHQHQLKELILDCLGVQLVDIAPQAAPEAKASESAPADPFLSIEQTVQEMEGIMGTAVLKKMSILALYQSRLLYAVTSLASLTEAASAHHVGLINDIFGEAARNRIVKLFDRLSLSFPPRILMAPVAGKRYELKPSASYEAVYNLMPTYSAEIIRQLYDDELRVVVKIEEVLTDYEMLKSTEHSLAAQLEPPLAEAAAEPDYRPLPTEVASAAYATYGEDKPAERPYFGTAAPQVDRSVVLEDLEKQLSDLAKLAESDRTPLFISILRALDQIPGYGDYLYEFDNTFRRVMRELFALYPEDPAVLTSILTTLLLKVSGFNNQQSLLEGILEFPVPSSSDKEAIDEFSPAAAAAAPASDGCYRAEQKKTAPESSAVVNVQAKIALDQLSASAEIKELLEKIFAAKVSERGPKFVALLSALDQLLPENKSTVSNVFNVLKELYRDNLELLLSTLTNFILVSDTPLVYQQLLFNLLLDSNLTPQPEPASAVGSDSTALQREVPGYAEVKSEALTVVKVEDVSAFIGRIMADEASANLDEQLAILLRGFGNMTEADMNLALGDLLQQWYTVVSPPDFDVVRDKLLTCLIAANTQAPLKQASQITEIVLTWQPPLAAPREVPQTEEAEAEAGAGAAAAEAAEEAVSAAPVHAALESDLALDSDAETDEHGQLPFVRVFTARQPFRMAMFAGPEQKQEPVQDFTVTEALPASAVDREPALIAQLKLIDCLPVDKMQNAFELLLTVGKPQGMSTEALFFEIFTATMRPALGLTNREALMQAVYACPTALSLYPNLEAVTNEAHSPAM